MQSTGEKQMTILLFQFAHILLHTQTQSSNGENRKTLFVSAAQEMMFPAEGAMKMAREAN
jgi:hypothetical protein